MGFLDYPQSAFGLCGLGLHSRLVSKAWMFQWAYFFFGFGEWACEPIFQTLSVIIINFKIIIICSFDLNKHVFIEENFLIEITIF